MTRSACGLFLQSSISAPNFKSYPNHCQWNLILEVVLVFNKSQTAHKHAHSNKGDAWKTVLKFSLENNWKPIGS